MNKKIIALIVTLILILASAHMVSADSPFNDIEDNWARNYIFSVYEKGLMNGTAADRFSPGDSVNKYSVIVAIAKMMGAEESEDIDELMIKYKVDLDKFKVPDYAQKETVFALEKEIILSDFDLDNMTEKPLATKLDICVYLGRAFKVKQDPTLPIQLFFRDTELVPRAYRGYVNHMIELKVVDGKGDANGDFKPNDLVTRAMFAKMLDEASNAYAEDFADVNETNDDFYDDGLPYEDRESVKSENEFEDNDDQVVSAKGYIDSITYSRKEKPRILLEVEGKSIKEFYILEDLIRENIIINGQLSDVHSLRPGMHVELNAQNKVVKNIATVEISKSISGEATIKEIYLQNMEVLVDIKDEEDDFMKEKRVFLKDAKIVEYTSLEPVYISDLRKGQSIIITNGIEDEEGIKATSIIAK